MPSIDWPLEQLKQYKPSLYREADFDDYWRTTVAEAVKQPLNAELIPYDLPARGIQCFAVRFDGYKGGRIAGWYLRPDSNGKFPGVVSYHGYSGRGARPLNLLDIAHQGICVLSMDCRGQNGQSQDAAVYPEGYVAGWMTQGIRDPQKYYYRHVYADAVRALELLARREEVDPKRLAITGVSQGGGITLAVAALSDRPALALPDIPYLCDYRRGVAITNVGPYPEIPNFIKAFPDVYEQAFRTLSYCDNLNLAPLIKCRTVISNCLWDDICPPSTIYGVYNHMSCEKQMEIYPFHKHEVPYEHNELKFRLITEALLETPAATKSREREHPMSNFFEFREKLTKPREEEPSPELTKAREQRALSVSELTRKIDGVLKQHLPSTLVVRGEVSNFSVHGGSGHVYFTLKDADACIDCVMWKSDATRMKFKPTDGMELLATGSIGVYAQRGKHQLYVRTLSPIGQGALELAFQQLRKKLSAEGLFAPERKKPLPAYPRNIAIVTGQQAAALHDVLKVLRRYSWLRLCVYAVPVQGAAAAPAIAAALTLLSRSHKSIGGIDAILLGRGGGSLEDLWAFNEEAVARAMAACAIPIITGIGHEVDVSIADLVADHHAHTPTEAAQVVTARWRNAADAVETSATRLRRGLRTMTQSASQRLDHITRHAFFRRPMDGINALRQLIDDRHRGLRVAMTAKLWELKRDLSEIQQSLAEHSPTARVRLLHERLTNTRQRLAYAARNDAKRRGMKIEVLERELNAVSPEAVLKRGFSLTTMKKTGALVRSVSDVRPGDDLVTRVADGEVESVARGTGFQPVSSTPKTKKHGLQSRATDEPNLFDKD